MKMPRRKQVSFAEPRAAARRFSGRHDDRHLDDLKQRFIASLRHIPQERPLLYLDYPVHLNIGDLLIMKGTEAAFADLGYQVSGRYAWMNFRHSITEQVDDGTTIVFHGGGNFGDLYPVHQRFRERIISHFPRNRIVILPQTIHFRSSTELDASARVFRRHPEVIIMVRDQASFAIARQHFSDQVHLVPDAAHYLWGRLDRRHTGTTPPYDVLYLLRNDHESAMVSAAAPDGEAAIDWLDLIPRWNQHLFGFTCRLHMTEGLLDRNLRAQPLWYRQSDDLVRTVLRSVGRFDAVVTNRLHACLSAALLGRPVTLLDNSYGKISHYFDAWLKDMSSIVRKG